MIMMKCVCVYEREKERQKTNIEKKLFTDYFGRCYRLFAAISPHCYSSRLIATFFLNITQTYRCI